jgi:hypothetical protein
MTQDELKKEVAVCIRLKPSTYTNCKRILKCYYITRGLSDEDINMAIKDVFEWGVLRTFSESSLERLRKFSSKFYQEGKSQLPPIQR